MIGTLIAKLPQEKQNILKEKSNNMKYYFEQGIHYALSSRDDNILKDIVAVVLEHKSYLNLEEFKDLALKRVVEFYNKSNDMDGLSNTTNKIEQLFLG